MHGGLSTGAKDAARPGNTNSLQHGFYSDALQPDELKLWHRVEIGSLDDELRLARVKLHRLVRLAGNADVAELIDSALEVAQKRDTHPELGQFEKSEIKVKVPQYGDLIVRQIDVIRKLELARLQLAEGAANAKDRERESANKGDEPVSGFEVTVVTPENYRPHDHGKDR
jgi:hypothetical protein